MQARHSPVGSVGGRGVLVAGPTIVAVVVVVVVDAADGATELPVGTAAHFEAQVSGGVSRLLSHAAQGTQ